VAARATRTREAPRTPRFGARLRSPPAARRAVDDARAGLRAVRRRSAVTAAVAVDRWAAAHPGAGAGMVIHLGDGVEAARTTALLGGCALRRARRAGSGRRIGEPADPRSAPTRRCRRHDPASLPASLEVRFARRATSVMSPTSARCAAPRRRRRGRRGRRR
jgi:hypothetical protein